MKKRLLKFFVLITISFGCLFCFSNLKVEASSVASNFVPFEIGDEFLIGDSISIENSNSIIPSSLYTFVATGIGIGDGYTFTIFLYLNESNEFIYSLSDGESELIPETSVSVFVFSDFELPLVAPWTLTRVDPISGSGLLGTFTEEEQQKNYIYNGIYTLFGQLIYGDLNTLDSVAIGNLNFISTLFTILVVSVPFIVVLFVIKKICD